MPNMFFKMAIKKTLNSTALNQLEFYKIYLAFFFDTGFFTENYVKY